MSGANTMKKPVKRVILLEDALSELMEAEDILAAIETKDVFQAFTPKQKQDYYDALSRLRGLIHNESGDTSPEQTAS